MIKITKNKIVLSFGIRTWLKNTFTRPNKNTLFVFGFQKSGTSAIAGLLAKKTGKSVTIDTPYFWNPYSSMIISGELIIADHVKKYSYPFSKRIIKEPNTTFFIPQLKEYFNLDFYIFIIRNPFDNIRSILNRLKLSGNLEDIDILQVDKNWRGLFEESQVKDYISVLASKWLEANNQPDIINSRSCILIRYEVLRWIKKNLSFKIGFQPVNSIAHLVDKQYQPKGNPNIDLKKF